MHPSRLLLPVVLLLVGGILAQRARPAVAPPKAEPHRSPIDLALFPDGKHALVANHTADSISVVDCAAGKVLSEIPVGHKPAGVALSRDGKRAAVSNWLDGTVSFFTVAGTRLTPAGRVSVGFQPRQVVFGTDGRLFVAVAAKDEVAVIDPVGSKVVARWPAPREPRHLALSADGKLLAASSGRSAQVRLWETASGKQVWERTLQYGFSAREVRFAPDGKAVLVAFGVRRIFPVSRVNIDQGWVIDSRLARLPIEPSNDPPYGQMSLDRRGKAIGDPHGVAFTPDGKTLVVGSGGTQELLLFQSDYLRWSISEPGDHLHPVWFAPGRFRRVTLGGRPLTIAFRPGTQEAVVANYLLDAVQVVDVASARVVRTIHLGGPATPGLARQGEALFYDARRSHHQWFSCNTCHTDGHTSSQLFDTINDGTYGEPKLTPTLRGVGRTAPYTWHGWQKTLAGAITTSLRETMHDSRRPTPDEVRALEAFMKSLEHLPSPHRQADGSLTPAARRGQAIFEGKARCVRCHQGPDYTTPRNYDVGLEQDEGPYKDWNPPTLRGVWDRGPFLHDGRANDLRQVLTLYHTPEKLGIGEKLTPAELNDLIAFLESL